MRTPIGALSKGQRKRALLAIGLLTSQPMLLADEPFEGLDLRQTREVAAVLRAHAHAGRTLFLSIHQIGDAARICDRFVLLSAGRVCGEGTLDELSALARARGTSASTLEEVFLALT
jgi:ABC-2 type transport system ATP-binding protein